MTTMKAAGRLITASVAERVLSYLLLPFGEVGRTSVGAITASAGAVTIPDTHIVGNLEHDPSRPLATSTTIEERPEGIVASFRVLPTTAGNDLLVEADAGVRTGISVEIADGVIRAGKLLAGRLVGAGFVAQPAFPSALLTAADAGDLPDELPVDTTSTSESTEEIEVDGVIYVRKTTSTYTTETTRKDGEALDPDADPDAETDPETDPEKESTPVTASTRKATGPATLLARTGNRAPAAQPAGRTLDQVANIIARFHASGDSRVLAELEDDVHTAGMLFAALSDIKYDSGTGAPGNIINQPAWLGELWAGNDYVRTIVDLFGHEDLTGLKMKGWKWDVAPEMAAWAGNKAAVPSNTPTAKEYDGTAKRYAGGHDHAREYVDFPNPDYWAGYFKAMTRSYAVLTNEAVAADAIAAATPVTVGAVPAGAAEGLVKVVDGVLSMVDFAPATFALLSPALWRQVLLTPQDKALEYLTSAMGVDEGSLSGFKMRPWKGLTADQVLVGNSAALTVHELPGSPIRVEGLDMVKGGVDTGLFGYAGTMVNDKRGLALVSSAPVGG